MTIGTVKWFNTTKGYGFIKPDDGGPDVFVHISAVEKAGYTGLAEGARISFEAKAGGSGKYQPRISGSDKADIADGGGNGWIGIPPEKGPISPRR